MQLLNLDDFLKIRQPFKSLRIKVKKVSKGCAAAPSEVLRPLADLLHLRRFMTVITYYPLNISSADT